MKSAALLAAVVACGAVASPLAAADDGPLGSMTLLPGYEHRPLQGIDSVVGQIVKEDGLTLTYEIGAVPKPGGLMLGGMFSDRPKKTPENRRRWYKEQTINGQPMHLAYLKDRQLLVSFPKQGMNVSGTVKTPEEMADVLLMLTTYPPADAE